MTRPGESSAQNDRAPRSLFGAGGERSGDDRSRRERDSQRVRKPAVMFDCQQRIAAAADEDIQVGKYRRGRAEEQSAAGVITAGNRVRDRRPCKRMRERVHRRSRYFFCSSCRTASAPIGPASDDMVTRCGFLCALWDSAVIPFPFLHHERQGLSGNARRLAATRTNRAHRTNGHPRRRGRPSCTLAPP